MMKPKAAQSGNTMVHKFRPQNTMLLIADLLRPPTPLRRIKSERRLRLVVVLAGFISFYSLMYQYCVSV